MRVKRNALTLRIECSFGHSGQLYKAFAIVIYDFSVVIKGNL